MTAWGNEHGEANVRATATRGGWVLSSPRGLGTEFPIRLGGFQCRNDLAARRVNETREVRPSPRDNPDRATPRDKCRTSKKSEERPRSPSALARAGGTYPTSSPSYPTRLAAAITTPVTRAAAHDCGGASCPVMLHFLI